MTKTHTVPNSATVQTVCDQNHKPMCVVIVRRGAQQLAHYPAAWNANRIPSLTELQRDARWTAPKREG